MNEQKKKGIERMKIIPFCDNIVKYNQKIYVLYISIPAFMYMIVCGVWCVCFCFHSMHANIYAN
jgi:hypothetical protein